VEKIWNELKVFTSFVLLFSITIFAMPSPYLISVKSKLWFLGGLFTCLLLLLGIFIIIREYIIKISKIGASDG